MILFYTGFPFFQKLILLAVRIVGLRKLLFSAWPGVYMTMKLGVKNKKRMTKEVLKEYMAPFKNEYGSQILTKTFLEGDLSELEKIVEKLPALTMPVHIIYGEDDWLLPYRKEEFRRLQQDLPNARLTSVPDCGHYLQEDQPEKVSQLLMEFLAE